MTDILYKPVRGSKTGKPIMMLFDLLGRRWAMGVLWQLCLAEVCTFRELQVRCESISPGVLNTRIRELRDAKLLTNSKNGYQATDLGKKIILSIYPLKDLAEEWVSTLECIDQQEKI